MLVGSVDLLEVRKALQRPDRQTENGWRSFNKACAGPCIWVATTLPSETGWRKSSLRAAQEKGTWGRCLTGG